MAIIKKSNFAFKGRIGLNTASIVHGVNILKGLPASVRNPRTSAQMDNRERFKTLSQLAAAFLGAANIGLKNKAKQYGPLVTVCDAFMKANQGAVSVMGGEAEVDYGSLKCSAGNLPQAGFGNASFAEPGRVSCTYSTSADMPGADAQDKEYLFIYQPDTKQGILSAPALRTTGTIECPVPSTWTGLTVHVYGFGIGDGRDNKGKISDSSYIGTGIIG